MAGSAAAASAAESVAGAGRHKIDLSDVNGIGPGYQKRLEEQGITLRLMAEWTVDDVDRWQSTLKARIRDERWVEQAQELLIRSAAEETEAPEPEAPAPTKPTRAEILQRMVKTAVFSAEPNDDDPLSGYSPEEVAELARKALAAQPKPRGELQKRGNVTHLRAIAAQPTFVPFNRAKAVLKRLDRNRKFAYQIGDYFGAHFSQKGRYFDHEGIEIPFGENGRPLTPDEIAELYVEEENIVTDVEDVNLSNWLEKKVDYPLPLVLKAVHHSYRKRFETEKAARSFLHQVLRGNV